MNGVFGGQSGRHTTARRRGDAPSSRTGSTADGRGLVAREGVRRRGGEAHLRGSIGAKPRGRAAARQRRPAVGGPPRQRWPMRFARQAAALWPPQARTDTSRPVLADVTG
jgi:hypothetical protein